MKLLLDNNLSFRLVRMLEDIYPGTRHVSDLGMASVDDEQIWQHASSLGFVIVSKDDDFRQRSLLRGSPPKVVWVKLGNCSTGQVAELLRRHLTDLQDFERDERASFLALGKC